MVGFTCLAPSFLNPISLPSHRNHLVSFPCPLTLKHKHEPLISLKPHPFLVFAENNNSDKVREERGDKQEQQTTGSKGEDVNNNKQRRPIFSFNLNTLLLDPDPDNVLALGLTGLLTWASVQVLWQLLFISLAILIAALKDGLRDLHTSLNAPFECDALKFAMVKNQRVAEKLVKGNIYDCVCKYEPAS